MVYATLMVHVELGRSNAPLLRIVGDLAEQLHASVIGIAGSQMMAMNYNDSYISVDVQAQIRDLEMQDLKKAEAEFRDTLRANAGALEWRSTLMCPSLPDYVAKEARRADVVLTTVAASDMLDTVRLADAGELIMQIGRPVLCVPASVQKPNLDNVVLAWKDTREARRAAFDALPLLKLAKHLVVIELAAESELSDARNRIDDVGIWLKRHGVTAECKALRSIGDEASQLSAIAHKRGAGVVVAGAYGHSRFSEFVFGGVTRALLRSTECCSLLSH